MLPYGSIFFFMGKTITVEKQKNIALLYKQGKTKNFIAKHLGINVRTVRNYLLNNNIEKKELSPTAKKLLFRQKKVNFNVFEQLKNQVQKDQKYLSNLNDPLTGCGRYALARAAKEANQASNYSKSLIEAIDNAQQLIALFKGQQELLGFNENSIDY
tara:strand:+ start:992 stop:1462 length:471 start_codon:yes stop_codon:yes gene_type:complete